METREAGPMLPLKKRRDREVYREAQKAIRQHIEAKSKLKQLGVLRSDRNVQSTLLNGLHPECSTFDCPRIPCRNRTMRQTTTE